MAVLYEQRGFLGIITLSRPEALNALNLQVLQQLFEILETIPQDLTRCLIITGDGNKAFAAGADVGEMQPMDMKSARALGEKGNMVLRRLELFPVPTIAAVSGYALGGGCELALACDIRIAGDNAVFGQPEVTLGITAGFGGTQRLSRLVGSGMAKELLYTGLKIDANEALQIGLVNHIYPQSNLMDEALKLAERIAKAAPLAVRATKQAVSRGYDMEMDTALAWETACFCGCFETEDQKNAMRAFVEKRKPEPFLGR